MDLGEVVVRLDGAGAAQQPTREPLGRSGTVSRVDTVGRGCATGRDGAIGRGGGGEWSRQLRLLHHLRRRRFVGRGARVSTASSAGPSAFSGGLGGCGGGRSPFGRGAIEDEEAVARDDNGAAQARHVGKLLGAIVLRRDLKLLAPGRR